MRKLIIGFAVLGILITVGCTKQSCLDIAAADLLYFNDVGANNNSDCSLNLNNANEGQLYVVRSQAELENLVSCNAGNTLTINFEEKTLLIGAKSFSSEASVTSDGFATNCKDNIITYTVNWETILTLPNAGIRTYHAIVPVADSAYTFEVTHSVSAQ